MTKRETDHKFDEIVSFAEIEKFIDTPVKRYSSGMYMRLAFAVAAHMETDILLVDEVLAVGDAAFQKKCLGQMQEATTKQGRTVVFVSHNMATVNGLCRQVCWLDRGRVHRNGPAEEVISEYLTSNSSRDGLRQWENGVANPGVDELRIDEVSIRTDKGEVASTLDVRKPFSIAIRYRVLKRLPYCRVGFVLGTVHGVSVFDAYDWDEGYFSGPRQPGTYSITCQIPGNLLNTGHYSLEVNAGVPLIKNLACLEGVLTFQIVDTGAVGSRMNLPRSGVIRPKLEWKYQVNGDVK
jgi:lipopolysaccharide transport system ATP-binding protein